MIDGQKSNQIEKILHNAVSLYQAGSLNEAEALYGQILQKDPDNADALHLLGVLVHQKGETDEAIELIKKAIINRPDIPDYHLSLGDLFSNGGQLSSAISCYQKALEMNPRVSEAYFNLGNAFYQLNDLEAAIASYQQAIEIKPDFAEAFNNMGLAFFEQKFLQKAIDCFDKARQIKPDYADAHNNMGNALQEEGRLSEAIACYHDAISSEPDNFQAFYNLGNICHEQGDFSRAILCYQKALGINPDYVDAYINIGKTYHVLRDLDQAIFYFEQAISHEPNMPELHFIKGNLLQDKFHLDESISCYKKAIALKHDYVDAYINMGNAFRNKDDHERAISCYREVLEIDPNHAGAYNNLGEIFHEQLDFEKAFSNFQRALAFEPDYAKAHFNLALALLQSNNLEQGWKEYEWRLKVKSVPISSFPQPVWDGSRLDKDILLVFTEQGIGDEIMFASCLPDVMKRTKDCIVECDKRLFPLFERSFTGINLIPRNIGNPSKPLETPHADKKIAMGSLPLHFRKRLKDFPHRKSYLLPDNKKVDFWRERFSKRGSGTYIGISWRAGKQTSTGRLRTIGLPGLKKLFSFPKIHLINLQYGDCRDELLEARNHLGMTIHDWEDADPLEDMDGFAAQIAALDLVISVDNSTAHLAGALGVPVWTLLPFSPDWRWMLDSETTPWYSSMRLFRQNRLGDWDDVFRRVKRALEEIILKKDTKANSSKPTGRLKQTPNTNPDKAEIHFNLGKALKAQGKLEEAKSSLLKAIEHNPEFSIAYNMLGNVLFAQGKSDEASDCYRRASQIDCRFSEAYFNLGNVLLSQDRPDEAIAAYEKAVSIRPDFAEAFYGMGKACFFKDRLDDAFINYTQAISVKPDLAEAYNDLGNVFRKQGRLVEAIAKYQKALKIRPDFAEVLCNISNVMKDKGNLDESITYCQKAIAMDRDLVIAHWNLGLALLARGDLVNGWSEYEWRLKKPEFRFLHSEKPCWKGEPISGQTILVRSEQGLGDSLQFIRFLPILNQYGAQVVFECPAPLFKLLTNFDGIDRLVDRKTDRSIPDIHFDTWIPLLSLPMAFGTTIASIPSNVPYLFSDPTMAEQWKRYINGDGLKIGIVWAGRPEHENDHNRTCALEHFKPLFNIPGAKFFGLQKGQAGRQVEKLGREISFTNFDVELKDFSDTAGVIENLDLIISVDTAVAHLAGAMGKPVWVLLPFSPDWRWMLERKDTPWYPTMKLFRQKQPGNWNGVFDPLLEEVNILVGNI